MSLSRFFIAFWCRPTNSNFPFCAATVGRRISAPLTVDECCVECRIAVIVGPSHNFDMSIRPVRRIVKTARTANALSVRASWRRSFGSIFLNHRKIKNSFGIGRGAACGIWSGPRRYYGMGAMAIRDSARGSLACFRSDSPGPPHAIAVSIEQRVPTKVALDRQIPT
jgi:hypothetical protein